MLLDAAFNILNQYEPFLNGISPNDYIKESQATDGTIGKHLRHVLDHFSKLIIPLANSSLDSKISIAYDRRERNVPMESNIQIAKNHIKQLQSMLLTLNENQMAREVEIHVMVSSSGQEISMNSSAMREIWYLFRL